jgi:hypothetical protein
MICVIYIKGRLGSMITPRPASKCCAKARATSSPGDPDAFRAHVRNHKALCGWLAAADARWGAKHRYFGELRRVFGPAPTGCGGRLRFNANGADHKAFSVMAVDKDAAAGDERKGLLRRASDNFRHRDLFHGVHLGCRHFVLDDVAVSEAHVDLVARL